MIVDPATAYETIQAWRCIGCGRLEAPQPCIGVCQDRRVEFVYASEHAALQHTLAVVREQRDALASLVRRLAWSRPRANGFERSYGVLQAQARMLLRALAADGVDDPREPDAAS